MAGVADTSLLYAVMDADAPEHEQGKAILRRHLGIEIPPTIWSELELLVRNRGGRACAREQLPKWLAANPQVGIMDADLHPVAMEIWSRRGRLSYADCHAIAGALLLNCELLTLDARQATAWRAERQRA